jgi:hypothetical protein
LKGYDAVAYFKQGKPVKGNPEIKSSDTKADRARYIAAECPQQRAAFHCGSSKGLVDFYQGVVAGPKNGGVNFAARRVRHGACARVDY